MVDMVSTWRSLGPTLSCDSRPMMVRAIAELLALVPRLTVRSEEYEVPSDADISLCVFVSSSQYKLVYSYQSLLCLKLETVQGWLVSILTVIP